MKTTTWVVLLFVMLVAGAPFAVADVVTDANAKAAEIASKLPGTPPAVRTMAIVQVSVFDAVSAISGRYPAFRAQGTAPAGAPPRPGGAGGAGAGAVPRVPPPHGPRA